MSILVICEHEGGSFKKTASELLGKASELAASLGTTVAAAVLADAPAASLGAFGATKAYQVGGDFSAYDTDRVTHTAQQREAVLKAFAQYAPGTMIVFDVDLGHTDPQVIIPVGGTIQVNGPDRTITVTY